MEYYPAFRETIRYIFDIGGTHAARDLAVVGSTFLYLHVVDSMLQKTNLACCISLFFSIP